MNFRTLRHVVALARSLNYTKAAGELGISQPVLSRSIQEFERQQGVRLFNRDRRGVSLTPAGKAFANRAKVLLREFDELEESLKGAAEGTSGELNVGIAPLPAEPLLANILIELSSAAPELSISAYVRNIDALLTLLESEHIECFISAEAFFPEPHHLRSLFLGEFPVVPLVRPDHPLLNGGSADDAQYPLLVSAKIKDVPHIPPSIKPFISKRGRISVEHNEALFQLTKASNGIWMTSPLDALQQGQLVEIAPPKGDVTPQIQIVMYSLSGHTLSPAAMKFRDLARAGIRSLHSNRAVATTS